ncbi:MAG: glutathione S-transferase N-terminal domain-containing protein [Gammaproteobacteria bacterium]|nr:glutathione S-transferase N-terminal domain-containing protein [Gammaproteobacteria bacterium]
MLKLPHSVEVSASLLASQMRGWRGTAAFRPALKQPEKPLELYEFEASPYCRLVREALTELDLDAAIYPCPKGGTRFRPRAVELGGKSQFPFLVDPNTGRRMHESADIVRYLADTYDGRVRGPAGLARQLAVGSSYLASAMRAPGRIRGMKARPSRAPQQPLELYSFESSPYSRLVREVLCELELPYLLRSTGKARWEDMGPPWVRRKLFPHLPIEGRNRTRLKERTGRVQVPYLIDPNTGTEMFESAAIVAYLEKTYAG